MTALDRLVDALSAHGQTVRPAGQHKATAQCPAHEDRNPSLSLTQIDGQVLVHCHAGCEIEDVLTALDLAQRDLFDEARGSIYRYTDTTGNLLRTVSRTPEKRFRQSGNTKGTPTLYRLPELVEAVKNGQTVYLVEGEKDVHALVSLGHVATTAPQGASNVDKADLTPLHGADVVAIVDNDEAGQKWAEKVLAKLDGKAKSLTFKAAQIGKDAADHVAADLDVDQLVDLEVAPAPALRRARITWASEIEPEPVVWAWQEDDAGRIPAGSLCIAAGREGTGKSSFGIWKAAQITRGTLPGSFHGEPRTVFYVAVEDSWKHTLVPRLMAAGADLSRVARLDVVSIDDEEVTLSLPHDNTLLEREIKKHGVALVVIDPLMSVIGERIDTHREREVRSALDPLAKIADRTGAVILGIAHFNKGSGTDAASLITGSGAFKNVPRSVFGFARDEADENGGRVMTQVKNSLGRDDLPSLSYVIESAEIDTKKGIATTGRFTFTGESDRSVSDVLRDSRSDPDDLDERRDAASWIRDYLTNAGGEAPAKDVLAAGREVGYKEQTLKNARRKVASTDRTGFGRDQAHTWILRTGTPTRTTGTTNETPVPAVPVAVPVDSPAPPERPGCEVCGKRLGRQEAAVGTCLMCQRIAAANQRARSA